MLELERVSTEDSNHVQLHVESSSDKLQEETQENETKPSLREKLMIYPSHVLVENFGVENWFENVNLDLLPGELCMLISPEVKSSRQKINTLLHVLGGRGRLLGIKKSIPRSGHAFALTKATGERLELADTKSPLLGSKTTLYRKATPEESLRFAIWMDGFVKSSKEVKQIVEMIKQEFKPFMDTEDIFTVKAHVGDMDVDEGSVSCGRNVCCQHMHQLSSLHRRQLEFLCRFVESRRADLILMNESKRIPHTDLWKLCTFFRQVASVSEQTSFLIRTRHACGRLFNLCDKIVVLAEGQVVFTGPREKLSSYLHSLPKTLPVDNYSPLEFFLDQVDSGLNGTGAVEEYAELFRKSFDTVSETETKTERKTIAAVPELTCGTKVKNWFRQAWEVFKRTHRNYVRTPGLTTLRILLYLVFGVMTFLVLLSVSERNAGTRMWMAIANFDFTVAASLFGLYALRLERKSLQYECSSNSAYLSAWICGHFLGSAFGVFYCGLIPAVVSIFAFGFEVGDDSGALVLGSFIGTYWSLLLLCESLWTFVALVIPQKNRSTVIASFIALAFVLGQGVFTKMANLPANRYVLFVTLFRPAMNAIFAAHFTNDDAVYYLPQEWSSSEECTVNPNVNQTWTNNEILDCMNVTVWTGQCPISPVNGTLWTGDEALECLKYKPGVAGRMAGFSYLVIFGINLITYITIRFQIK